MFSRRQICFGSILTVGFAGNGAVAAESLRDPDLHEVFQRKSNGAADIPFTIHGVTSVDTVEFRILDAHSDLVIVDWSRAIRFGQTEWLAPEVPSRLGWNVLQVRANGRRELVLHGSNKFGVGRLIGIAGQSLAVRMLGNIERPHDSLTALRVALPQFSSCFATYVDLTRSVVSPRWSPPTDQSPYNSAFAADFLIRQEAAYGCNCALVGHAKSGTEINDWISTGRERQSLREVLDRTGGFEAFIWVQGHADASAKTSMIKYQAGLTSVFKFLGGYAVNPRFGIAICAIPNVALPWKVDESVERIRSASRQWALSRNAHYLDLNDIDLVDAVHQTQKGNIQLARAFSAALAG